jgi:hypothetical protein
MLAPSVPVTFKLYAADVGPPICQLLSSSQLSGGFTSVVTAPGTQRADAGPSPPGPSPHSDSQTGDSDVRDDGEIQPSVFNLFLYKGF